MYDWILKKDEYTPLKDKDSFLGKNILAILGVLSNLRRKKNEGDGWIYKVNVFLKTLFTLAFILSLSLTRELFYALLVNVYMLSFLLFINRFDRSRIIKLLLSALLFSFLVVMPSLLFYSNLYNAVLLFFRITGSIICINIFAYSCFSHQVTGCMRRWFVPDIFIMIFDLTLKYIIILGDCSIDMFRALILRSVGVNKKKSMVVSNILGVLFLKSKKYSEELYDAMLCRCFDPGNYSSSRCSVRFGKYDICYAFMSLLVLGMVFI